MADQNSSVSLRVAWWCYGLSVVTIAGGASLAAAAFPGGFDWAYEVMSALASRKHNPAGSFWFAGGLAIGMGLLFPMTYRFSKDALGETRSERVGAKFIWGGLVFGVLVGLERLVFFHLSDVIGKAHEALALFSFLSLFGGLLLLALTRGRRAGGGGWSALAVVLPLVAIGASQLAVYLDQRDLGWVDTDWRRMGVPLWYSFAFWQWSAAGSLWLCMGWLLWSRPGRN